MFRYLFVLLCLWTSLPTYAQNKENLLDTVYFYNTGIAKRWLQPDLKILNSKIYIRYSELPFSLRAELQKFPNVKCDSGTFKQVIYRDANTILKWCDKNGYLTSQLYMQPILISDTLQLTWHLQLQHQYKLDSVICLSKTVFKKSYVLACLKLKLNKPVNYYDLANISTQLSSTDFITESKPSQLYLTSKQAKLYVYPERKPASQFEGLLGIQNQTLSQSPIITGDINVVLKHQLWHHGEVLDLKWRRLQFQTQDIQFRFQFPFWLGTPIGSRIEFQIYRRDTSFIDVKQKWGMQYQSSATQSYGFYYNKHQTSPLGLVNSDTIGQFVREAFGVTANWKLNVKPFPYSNGITCDLTFQTGNRYSKAYTNTPQFLSELKFRYVIPLTYQQAICFQLNSSALYSSQRYFANEMFRIGGFKTLRGFDEESIWCSAYAVSTLEYHWMLSSESFLYVFYDQAAYERQLLNSYVRDFPYSSGLGLQLKINSGSINLCYALGSQFKAPLGFSTAKIHVGYKAVF